jgi:type I restriction enzyme S subunit
MTGTWKRAKLNQVAEVVTGSTPKTTSSHFFGGTIPFVTPGDLDGQDPIRTTSTTLTEDGMNQVRRLPVGAVLVSCIGSLGKTGIAGVPLATNQQINALIFDPKQVDSRFGLHVVRTLKNTLEQIAPSTTLKIVNKSRFADLSILLPHLSEQRRIAAILDQAEALRTKRRQALAKLDTLTQSLFLEIFGNLITNSKNLKVEALGKYLKFVTSGSRGWACYYAPTGARFIRSLDVQMNHIGRTDVAFVVPPDNAEARRTRVELGDVLLTITGSRIGRVAPVESDCEGAFISQHVAILRPDQEKLEAKFLAFFLSLAGGGQRQIATAQYGQTKPGLNFDQIRRFRVPIPPLELQREFLKGITTLEKLKAYQSDSSIKLDALFASLQNRAFRGEL